MPTPSPNDVETLFLEVVDLPAEQRTHFLDRRCGNDSDLKRAVLDLLAADAEAGEGAFLNSTFFDSDPKAKTTTPTDPESDPDGTPQERFRILAQHRQGGLGEVLLAHDRELDREVAVKQIKPKFQGSDEARERFIQEAKVTGRLEHPGIVPVYAMGTWPDGQHYYAMRFIEGETMKTAIAAYHQSQLGSDDADQLRFRELLTRFVDVCNTLQYAHSKHVLHRDIKPSNIMVGPYGETLVVDWGLAKLLDEPAEESMTAAFAGADPSSGSTPTQIGGTVGTPSYMSPEQAGGKLDEIGIRTDVYLLGATLYQILTGRPPHQDESISRLLDRIRRGVLDRPRQLNPKVPPALEAICLKAMATRPEHRYREVEQIAADINRYLADQAVSVHPESWPVRVSRWMRHHRTTTTSLAVAACLLVIGSLTGSILWNQSRAREFAAKSETMSKALQLELNAQRRIAELRASTEAAEKLAENELRRNRYGSALEILRGAMEPIRSEPDLEVAQGRVREKASRLEKIVEFYRLAEYVHEQNVLSRDTKALLASTAALKTLGAWERLDWWTALPDDDLAPHQVDALRWEVYRQWVLMDAMLIKQIGVQLIGDDPMDTTAVIRAATRMLTTEIGKPKAEAALRVSDRIDRFRFSEAARFYRSVARTRLGGSSWVKGDELGIPRNSADGHSLGVLCMIAALDPGFEVFFRNYQGDDALHSARFAFRQAVSMQADHYWSQLALAQIEFLIAQRNDEATWEDYEPAAQILSHCISLSPDKCFAHSDRSSVYRIQARLLRNDQRYSVQERERRAVRFLRWSLEDSQRAMHWADKQPWVGWPTAMIYADSGKFVDAVNLLVETSFRAYPFVEIGDATLLKVDDLRGRAEAADWLETQRNDFDDDAPNQASRLVALAAIRLNQFRFSDAAEAAEQALAIDEQSIAAFAVRAMVRLHTKQFDQARKDFQTVFAADPQHPWATFGLAVCDENDGDFANAMAWYRDAVSHAASDENRAAAALGQSRCAALLGRFPLAESSIRQAIAFEPACDIMSVVWPLGDQLVRLKKATDASDHQTRVRDLIAFLKLVQSLPRATKAETIPTQSTGVSIEASLLNGDFELGMKYWDVPIASDPAGQSVTRQSEIPFDVSVSDQQAYSGGSSLAIRRHASQPIAPSTLVAQHLTIESGKRYHVRCWAKASNLPPQSILLRSTDGATLLKFASGSYDWTLLETVWETSASDSPGALVRQSIELAGQSTASSDSGTLWLDDLTITTVE